MSDESEAWHMMPVAILAILWNLAGCADYVMTQYGVAPYLQLFTQTQAAYFTSVPAFVDGAWAVAVWGGLLGAVLLFLRVGAAPWVLGFSALGMTTAAVWLIGFATPGLTEVAGYFGDAMIAGAAAMAILFYAYARRMRVLGEL
ncbi:MULTISPECIES: hypothetical protein [Rhodovulum]|uniref:Uncharacterized protein n=2 Tax=Rhodovulum TaxID=34008 RepID=A0A8E2VN10_9RHOB|nr:MULTISPECIES: hypothetical protein [Rhodovulum]PTW52091.1 hypothetical protein C8N38_101396 [Rhodovulum kholense]RAP43247.1 hypothetical protein BYZ73_00630 [Rhodovulum viride]